MPIFEFSRGRSETLAPLGIALATSILAKNVASWYKMLSRWSHFEATCEATFENVASLVALQSNIAKRHLKLSSRWSHFEATLWSNISKCRLVGRTLKQQSEATFVSLVALWSDIIHRKQHFLTIFSATFVFGSVRTCWYALPCGPSNFFFERLGYSWLPSNC